MTEHTGTARFIVLGCGNSAGTPAICNHWGNCDPAEPRNRRTRPSAAICTPEGETIIIDTGPDFREQVNKAGLTRVDAVLYTHAHADHVNGIDDLRVVRNRSKRVVPIYMTSATLGEIERHFDYMFSEKHDGLYPKVLDAHVISDQDMQLGLDICGLNIKPFRQDHGTCETTGYRVGDLAYSTDVISFDDQAIAALQGVKTWIVDAAGYKMPNNFVHMNLRDLYAINERVGASHVLLTHMSPAMDYRTLMQELPEGYEPAYDGMELDINL